MNLDTIFSIKQDNTTISGCNHIKVMIHLQTYKTNV